MSYEIVLYKYGTSLYHKIGDNAVLRPNVEEMGRYKFDIPFGKTSPQMIHYLYKADDKKKAPYSPIFMTKKECEEWRKMNKLKYGEEGVFIHSCYNDAYYDGHR